MVTMTKDVRSAIRPVISFLLLAWFLLPASAQTPQASTSPGPPAGQLPPRISPGPNVVPKPGVCPLPILPAIPDYADTTFFANTDVPHGKVEIATYKNSAGVDKAMH